MWDEAPSRAPTMTAATAGWVMMYLAVGQAAI